MKNLPSILLGAILGIALVLACGDQSPPAADAAQVCDCPAAEPPIAARIAVVKLDVSIPASSSGGNSLACPAGSTLLSGSCDLPRLDLGVTLRLAGFVGNANNAWACEWTNTDLTAVDAQIRAKCLMP